MNRDARIETTSDALTNPGAAPSSVVLGETGPKDNTIPGDGTYSMLRIRVSASYEIILDPEGPVIVFNGKRLKPRATGVCLMDGVTRETVLVFRENTSEEVA